MYAFFYVVDGGKRYREMVHVFRMLKMEGRYLLAFG